MARSYGGHGASHLDLALHTFTRTSGVFAFVESICINVKYILVSLVGSDILDRLLQLASHLLYALITQILPSSHAYAH